MKFAVTSTAALLLAFVTVCEAIECQDPTPFEGDWVKDKYKSKECVALVKEKCGIDGFTTKRWVRGDKVSQLCDEGQIHKWTAIATFMGEDDGYEGHAAIFESCTPDGISVYDQNVTHRVGRRYFRFGGYGDLFYTIKIQ